MYCMCILWKEMVLWYLNFQRRFISKTNLHKLKSTWESVLNLHSRDINLKFHYVAHCTFYEQKLFYDFCIFIECTLCSFYKQKLFYDICIFIDALFVYFMNKSCFFDICFMNMNVSLIDFILYNKYNNKI